MSNGSRTSIHVVQHSELPQSASEQSNSKLQSAKLYAYTLLIQAVLFFLMLICTVFSQISLVNLTNQLRLHTWIDCSGNATDNDCLNQVDTEDEAEAIAVFWYIVIILMIPNLHTFIKSFMHGVRSQQNLWPSIVSGFVGALVSIIEVWVMCTVIFLGISVLPPGLNLFLLNGVCVLQVLLVIVSMVRQRKSKNEYLEVSGEDTQELPSDQNSGSSNEDQDTNQRQSQQLGSLNNDGQDTEQQKLCSTTTFRNIIIIILLNVALLIAQVVLLVFLEEKYWKAFTSLLMGMIFFTFFLSINAQKNWMSRLACISTYQQADQKHSRTMYKSSLINATVRLICYPFFAYLIFRNMTHHKIDPWCSECTNLQGITLVPFLIHIFTTYGAYWIAWFASAMALRRSIFVALIFSTPVSIAAYYGSAARKVAAPFFFLNITEHSDIAFIHDPTIQPWYIFGMVFGSLVWIVFTFALILHCCRYKGKIMALDEEMFMTPYYDSIFFQQHLFLNMKTQATIPNPEIQEATSKLKMYICLPMYKESAEEMKTLLESVKGFALTAAKKGDGNEYECHIVFDNGVQNTKTTKFSSQLLELIKETTEKDCADAKYETEYGWCCRWEPGFGDIPLIVHLKDPTKVRNKKRWSQVLYMKLIIEHYKSMENAYILTTDGDVSFDYQSVDCLIDRMKSDNKVGCVCARTHPKGSGILYWYQKFDYAIGHWLQKSAEDVLGCVLCCPGCFSLFRCTALKEVLDEYSKPAESGIEFLRRNMGEDRWLCTMLVEKGHRLVYCAISSVKTSCPESFAQFFAQRRRWIPSTIANIASLISKRSVITKQSDYISSLFILYQILNIVSTAISPATVVFMISNGLKSAYGLSETANQALIAFVIILGIVFGLICLFSPDKTQMDIAKILTLVFIAFMILVLVGLVKEIIHLIPHYHPNNPALLNCTSVMNNTQKNGDCITHYVPPVSLIYLAFFTAIFALTTIFHFSEWTNIFHGLTFFIALPTGYFLLPIYCAANLKNQSWGTREERAKEDKGLIDLIKDGWSYMKCCRSRTHSDLEASKGDSNQKVDDSSRSTSTIELVESHKNQAEVDFWKKASVIDILRKQNADKKRVIPEEKKIEESLSTLRNTSLAALLVVNLLWILLLYTIEFVEIHGYIEPFGVKTLELVFLSLYALLLFIQFAAMIIHRIITLVHYIGTFSKGTEGEDTSESSSKGCKVACRSCIDTLNKTW